MSSNTNVKSMVETSQKIFEAANFIVESMANGDRKQIKELAEEVSTAVGMEPKQVLGFVHHFAHHTDIAYVTRGKHGGIIRGTKVAKVVKPKKAKKDAVVV